MENLIVNFTQTVQKEYEKTMGLDKEIQDLEEMKNRIGQELVEIKSDYDKISEHSKDLYEKMNKDLKRSEQCKRNDPKFTKKYNRFIKSQDQYYRVKERVDSLREKVYRKFNEKYPLQRKIVVVYKKKEEIYKSIQGIINEFHDKMSNQTVLLPTNQTGMQPNDSVEKFAQTEIVTEDVDLNENDNLYVQVVGQKRKITHTKPDGPSNVNLDGPSANTRSKKRILIVSK